MKRVLATLLLVGLVAAGIVYVQHLSRDGQYRRLLAEGEEALRERRGFAAIAAFSGALALRPDSMVAHYRRGEAFRLEKQDAEAIRELREAVRIAPEAPHPLIALGDLYESRGEAAEAATWYGLAADLLEDEDPDLLHALALMRFRAGSPATAIDPLRRALARDDSLASSHYLLGLALRDVSNTEEAVRSLERAVRLAPSLSSAREELADLYREQGRTADEMAQLQALAALDNDTGRQVAIAFAEMRNGQFDSALGTLAETSVGAPKDSQVQLAICRVLLARAERTGDRPSIARALTMLEQALGGSAQRSEGLALFGRALYISGDAEAAVRMLREAIATSPIDREAFAFLADAAERQHQWLVARDALVNLDVLEGDTAASAARTARARRIGALSLEAGDALTALTYLLRIVDAGHADANTFAQVARARWQTGDAAGARAALGQAIALDARSDDLRRLSRTIK
jgi:tetratricopeptide (TPR) repeat protein